MGAARSERGATAGNRIDDLEKSIAELTEQAGVEGLDAAPP